MHPDQNLTTFFINGITQGFRIGFDHTLVSLKSSRRNLESAQSHIAVVDDYLKTEIALARIAGPFSPNAVGQGQISRFGVIQKIDTCLPFGLRSHIPMNQMHRSGCKSLGYRSGSSVP